MKAAVKGMRVLAVLAGVMVFSFGVAAQGPPPQPQPDMRPPRPPQPDMTIDAQTKTEAIHELAKDLGDMYLFPDTGGKMAAMLEEHLAHGDYNSITSAKEFAATVNKQIRDIAHDEHLHFGYSAAVLPREDEDKEEPDEELKSKRSNYGLEEVKRLDGNIGYLNLKGFEENGEPTAAGAMAFLANTDAMIIDLRDNSGGHPSMTEFIASYFFSGDKSVHLNDLAYRIKGAKDYTTTQSWVLPYVPGQRYVDKEVYILTNHRTFSGGEEFAYDLQALKRATIVGENTLGGAHPSDDLRISDHFRAQMPIGQAINPITHTNWDGVGVKPDVNVPAADALKTAEKMALEHLIAKTTDPQAQGALKQALEKLEANPAQQKQK